MINSIEGTNSTMSMMRSGPMERHQPPPGKDVFQTTDADRDGRVSRSELETLAKGIEEITGSRIDVDEALSSFDADEDGALSGEELKGFMESNGFTPPGMFQNDKGEAVRMPPPPSIRIISKSQSFHPAPRTTAPITVTSGAAPAPISEGTVPNITMSGMWPLERRLTVMEMTCMGQAPSDLTQRSKTDLWAKAASAITIMSA